jgi:hypothetical protein
LPLEEAHVLILLERVTDAQRQAARQLKEIEERQGKKMKRKNNEEQAIVKKRKRDD